jgi:hypothetical protein
MVGSFGYADRYSNLFITNIIKVENLRFGKRLGNFALLKDIFGGQYLAG